ncbi:hypothetical protein [Glutamicibacter mishrai]|uniref:DNA-binding protein n=1 Tax=Glutamicibacter mishrai TaxID=1775880 RepID=A0A6H0SM73_9MICC|nr:hypothetical protein [Glutamicibacter mishrai]QIV87519.1 hypothetical protein D3791_10555 [Glutamicibacter mishrai]
MTAEVESPFYQSPEAVAPTLGMTKTELRRYAKESGHFTTLSKNRMALDPEDIENIKTWVKTRNQQNRKKDPFA